MEKKQTMRFSDAEIDVLKTVFKDNDDLIKIVRKILLQLPLSESETKIAKATFEGKTELVELINKFINPSLDGDAPLHQMADMYLFVPITQMLPEVADSHLRASARTIEYLAQQMLVLFNPSADADIKLSEMIDPKVANMFEDVLTRNGIISHIEKQLSSIYTLSNRTVQELEDLAKAQKLNSAK